MKKSRFIYLHPSANPGKVAALDALQAVYTAYLRTCVETMIAARRFAIPLREMQAFFPRSAALTSQIVKNARAHAVSIVSGWAASKHATMLRALIKAKHKKGEIDQPMRVALALIGKRAVDRAGGNITQAALDLYWSWLLDVEIVGKTPAISERCGMRMSEMTAVLAMSEDTKLTAWWIGFSHLAAGKARIQLPLAANPFVRRVNEVSKGVLARKDRRGRWRFEVVDKRAWEVPEATPEMPRVGVDVGLNVMVATSDGLLLGAALKPKFNALYAKVRNLRSNRFRQELKRNSPRLDRMESKLTGMVKTLAGACTNTLVAAYPSHAFVIEDLDLRGSRGAKRFAYRAVHHSLEAKAPTLLQNPAYTSQMCPSCGYVSRANRSGVVFHCRSCGRKGHADVVGGINLLGRSEDEQVGLDEDPSAVRAILRERYRARRRDSSSGAPAEANALAPSSRRLTTGVPRGTGTASNPMQQESGC